MEQETFFEKCIGTTLLLFAVVAMWQLSQGHAVNSIVWLVKWIPSIESDTYGIISKMLTASFSLVALIIGVSALFHRPQHQMG